MNATITLRVPFSHDDILREMGATWDASIWAWRVTPEQLELYRRAVTMIRSARSYVSRAVAAH